MAMIQGIDGGALINAFRAGKQDRYADEDRQLKMRAMQEEAARKRQMTGLMGQVFGGGEPSGGLSGAYASSAPMANPTLSPEESGAAPMTAAPAQQHAQRGGVNYDALAQLSVIDPEAGGKIASALKTTHEAQIKQMDTKNMAMASASHYLAKIPQAQRAQYMQQVIAPHLAEAGWTPQELQNADLSDRGLGYYQAQGMDMEKLLAAELAERKFQAGDNVGIQPGGAVINVKPDGTGSYVVKPFQMGSEGGTGGIPQAAIDHLRQNPDLKSAFDEKYGAGASDAILGGGAGNGVGGFPGQ